MNDYKIRGYVETLILKGITLQEIKAEVEHIHQLFQQEISRLKEQLITKTTQAEREQIKTQADALYADFEQALTLLETSIT